jgi:hypothetical protein
MGFKYSYNIATAAREINAAAYDACDNKLEGFTQWGAKQDLYRLKWILEDALKRCPKFSIEDEWLREQSKKQLIEVLKDE